MQCLIGIDNVESKSRLAIRDPEYLLLYICIYLAGFPLFLNFHYFHQMITR